MAIVSLCQLSALTLYVEHVMCFIPMSAIVLMRVSWFSFMYGIIGSMRIAVGIPASWSFSAVFRRSDGGGASGSRIFAVSSSSVVMVRATVEGIFFKMSISLNTMFDFVII